MPQHLVKLIYPVRIAQDSEASQHISLSGFKASECLEVLAAMAEVKGFTLERGALRSPQLGELMDDLCRQAHTTTIYEATAASFFGLWAWSPLAHRRFQLLLSTHVPPA